MMDGHNMEVKEEVMDDIENLISSDSEIDIVIKDEFVEENEYQLEDFEQSLDEINERDYCEVEYLDEDLLDGDEGQDDGVSQGDDGVSQRDEVNQDDDSQIIINIRKRATRTKPGISGYKRKKLPPHERCMTYKQYTAEDFKNCIEAVRSNRMDKKEASRVYNVPLKTIAAKIRAGILEKDELIPATKLTKFIEEIQTIMNYTNVTPFKSRFNDYYCGFCPKSNTFNEPQELRDHVLKHKDRVKRVEFMLRPYSSNEMIKIDINNLTCIKCNEDLTWPDLFTHLRQVHNKEFDFKNFIIPFHLDVELKCVICNNYYSALMNLDSHMNAHYPNYTCNVCNESYVTAVREKAHRKIHEASGTFHCEECGRVFTLERYLKKHQQVKHKHRPLYKCSFCKRSFKTEKLKNGHILNEHPEKINEFKCHLCGDVFQWEKMLQRHLYKVHNKMIPCEVCGRMLNTMRRLKEHLMKHSGVKSFECRFCDKSYYTNNGLQMHMKSHNFKIYKVVRV